jgi:glycine/D-amino acid oxidase-like deaminating enzyme
MRFRITHAWSGKVAMTFDKVAHMGRHNGVHYAVGCNGNGVALMTYLGHQTALKLLGNQVRPCEFDTDVFPTEPFYAGGEPWFLPIVSAWYRLNDAIDRRRS